MPYAGSPISTYDQVLPFAVRDDIRRVYGVTAHSNSLSDFQILASKNTPIPRTKLWNGPITFLCTDVRRACFNVHVLNAKSRW